MIDILQFENEQAYENESFSNNSISLIKNIEEVRFDSFDMTTTEPEIGDALYADENENPIFFKGGDALNVSHIPNNYTPIGVVIDRKGYEVLIHYYTSPTLKFQEIKRWKLTGYQLDGNEHTSYIKITWTTTASANLDVTYSATTKEQLIEKLNEIIKDNDPTTDERWWATTDEDGDIVIQCDRHTNYQQTVSAGNGFVSTLIDNTELPVISSIKRKSGYSNTWAINNYQRGIEYRTNNGTNPTANVTISSNDVVRRSAYEDSEYCAALREHYGTYEQYIEAMCAHMPTNKLVQGWHNRAKEFNDILGSKTVIKQNGEKVNMFPATAYTYNLNPNCKGLKKGSWRIPSVKEDLELAQRTTYGLSGINYNNCDVINKTLYKMGGNVISLSAHRWLCVRYSTYSGWSRGSAGGVTCDYGWYGAFAVSAVAPLSLNN